MYYIIDLDLYLSLVYFCNKAKKNNYYKYRIAFNVNFVKKSLLFAEATNKVLYKV